MPAYTILLLIFFFISPLQAQIYTWTDNNGVVHFSDEPHPGAKQIVLPKTISSSTPEQKKTEQAALPENEALSFEYTDVSISQPKDEETIRNAQGFVPVVVNISPELQKGDLVQLIYDGQPLGKPQSAYVFSLENVLRGSHTIAVQILDVEGKVIKISNPITIFMQPPRVGMVPGTRPLNKAP